MKGESQEILDSYKQLGITVDQILENLGESALFFHAAQQSSSLWYHSLTHGRREVGQVCQRDGGSVLDI